MSFPDTVTVEIPTACAAEIVYRMRGGGGSRLRRDDACRLGH